MTDDDELIVSDDGSTDETLDIIQQLHDSRIKIIHNTKHGYVSNFENALQNAQGKYIFLSDQDDVWYDKKIEKCILLLQRYKLIVHNAKLINQYGNEIGISYFSTLHQRKSFIANLYKTRFLGCCMTFDNTILKECLPFPKRIVAHDYWIGMYALFKYPNNICFVDEELIGYRRHGNNVSSSSEKSTNSMYFKIITKRLSILICIFMRYISKTVKTN